MSYDSTFAAASEAAEKWPALLSDILYHGDQGEILEAYSIVYQLSDELKQHAEVLDAAKVDLDAVSDDILKHNGFLGAQSYSSAHEAATEITKLAVLALLGPLDGIEDRAAWRETAARLLIEWRDGLVVSSSDLRARMCRERAKLSRPQNSQFAVNAKPPTEPQLPANAKYNADNLPAEYRDGGEADGEPLTPAFLKGQRFRLAGHKLTLAYNAGKLKDRVKVGRPYAYRYLEVLALRDETDLNYDAAKDK